MTNETYSLKQVFRGYLSWRGFPLKQFKHLWQLGRYYSQNYFECISKSEQVVRFQALKSKKTKRLYLTL